MNICERKVEWNKIYIFDTKFAMRSDFENCPSFKTKILYSTDLLPEVYISFSLQVFV